MNRLAATVAVAAIALSAATQTLAQEPLDLRKLGNDLRRNQEELRKYQWNSKTAFIVDGVQRRMDTYQVRYDDNGWLQRMQTSSQVAEGAVRGPDGKKLINKQREAAHEFVTEAKNQLDAYLSPLFAEKAITSSTITQNESIITMTSNSVVHSGDTVEVVFSRATREPMALRATATIEGSPMSLDVTFGAIDYGPFHPARSITVTQWNGFELQITTENSEYSE